MATRDPRHSNALVYDHPLVQHKLTGLRAKATNPADFRRLLNEVAGLMAYEVCSGLPTREVSIETPVATAKGRVLVTPVTYYSKLPDEIALGPVILVDPMLATGGSAAHAVEILQQLGVKTIQLVCLVAAPEGLAVMQRLHPDVMVHTAAIDERLNEKCYIVPGLGDAGDRIFGTH